MIARTWKWEYSWSSTNTKKCAKVTTLGTKSIKFPTNYIHAEHQQQQKILYTRVTQFVKAAAAASWCNR